VAGLGHIAKLIPWPKGFLYLLVTFNMCLLGDTMNVRPTAADSPLAIRQYVMQLWCTALNVRTVADNDNFFSLGGHSLVALLLIDSVEQSLGVEVGGMRELCENPTLAEFVSLVTARQSSLAAPSALGSPLTGAPALGSPLAGPQVG
jgi:aryl carrier-like protein